MPDNKVHCFSDERFSRIGFQISKPYATSVLLNIPAKPFNHTECWCFFINHKKESIGRPPFKVVGENNLNVAGLKEKVKEEHANVLKDVDEFMLLVWKCKEPKVFAGMSPGEAEECIKGIDFGDEDEVVKPASQMQVKNLGLSNYEVLLVQMPDEEALYNEDKEDNRPLAVKRMKIETSKAAPSLLSDPFEFKKIVGQRHAIDCNRPFEYNTLPLALLHEAFGLFRDRCEAAPSESALTCLLNLADEACNWYEYEAERREVTSSVFGEFLDPFLIQEDFLGVESITDDGGVVVIPAAIRTCKNEPGDALNQAILYYSKFLSRALNHELHFYNFNTCFPCILMVDMGSLLGFYGAVWDGMHVRVEPLTQCIDLATHWRERNARNAIAATLDALLVAVENIQAHYKSIKAKAMENPAQLEYNDCVQKARRFPFLTSYKENGQEIGFTYDVQLNDRYLIFSATLNKPNSGQCIIKFTQGQYSAAAHNCLVSHGMAPRLRQCIQISADWTAVVMDWSKYKTLYNMRLSQAQQVLVQEKVKSVVRILHGYGFVHGDIRDTNILVDAESLVSGDVMVHIIDFEWAGRTGEVRYPIDINCKGVNRPSGVKAGELITEQHDIDMVSYLFTFPLDLLYGPNTSFC